MQFVPRSVFQEKRYHDEYVFEQTRLLAFHRQLDHDIQRLPNERCLARRLEEFMEMQVEDQRICWQITDNTDLHCRIQNADHESAAFIHANLCQFDHPIFNAMQADIYARSIGNPCSGAFLRCCGSMRT